MRVYQKHAGDDAKLLIKFHWPNQWEVCCKHYPSMDVSTDQEGSAFSDTEGSAEGDYSGTQGRPQGGQLGHFAPGPSLKGAPEAP